MCKSHFCLLEIRSRYFLFISFHRTFILTCFPIFGCCVYNYLLMNRTMKFVGQLCSSLVFALSWFTDCFRDSPFWQMKLWIVDGLRLVTFVGVCAA